MERLIAWYRVGSSVGAVVALLVANAIPLIGVLFLGWNVWTILTIYWLENGVVGVFNVLKMAKAAGPEPTGRGPMLYNGRPVGGDRRRQGDAHPVLRDALRHLLGRPRHLRADPAAVRGVRWRERRASARTRSPSLLVLVGLVISHGVSYRYNYIGRGEYLRTSVSGQMAAPYGRLVVLHLTIIVGGLAIAMTGAPSAAVLILVLLKTGLDLGLHLAEHRRAGRRRDGRRRGEVAR